MAHDTTHDTDTTTHDHEEMDWDGCDLYYYVSIRYNSDAVTERETVVKDWGEIVPTAEVSGD